MLGAALCGSPLERKRERKQIMEVLYFIGFLVNSLVCLLLQRVVYILYQMVVEIREYLNARDEIPFFGGVFDEKSDACDLAGVIDHLRDAFPGKRPGGGSCDR